MSEQLVDNVPAAMDELVQAAVEVQRGAISRQHQYYKQQYRH